MSSMPDGPGVTGTGRLDAQLAAWRGNVLARRAFSQADVAELEDHLREQIESLQGQGLADDEAFLVAVKRMGAIDGLTREFAREHSERLWKQLVLAGDGVSGPAGGDVAGSSRRMWVALALAVAAAIAIRIPVLFGLEVTSDVPFYLLNLSFFTLPFIAAYFAWERPVAGATRTALAVVFVGAAVVVNLFPYAPSPGADTELLTLLHLPIALWLPVGIAYVGGRWRGSERRLDFIRFTGELIIYYGLLAIGGGVLIGLTLILFQAIGLDAVPLVDRLILPCGIAGAAVVAAWLVEGKQSVIENMAPVLGRIFSPMVAVLLVAFLLTIAVTGRSINAEREILIVFDLLLVVVFGLLLYSISARDPLAPPGLADWIQLALVGAALVVDVLALWAVGTRISDFGFTPNRVTALGENAVLLVNLAGSALLYGGFLGRRVGFSRLWDWQTGYVYVLAGWAAIVAFGFPLLFGFA